MSNLRYLLAITLSIIITGCATTGPGGKKSLIIIPTSYEVAIGQGMAEQISRQEKILPDTLWQNYITEVGQRIADVSDRKGLDYHFAVIESDQINAFAAPGGFIYFYTGLLKTMNSEAELAAVMAHEIAHVVARHGIKRLQTAMGAQLAYQLVFGDEGAGQALDAAIGIGLNLAFADYSRDAEREADQYGVIYMTRAGYDPRAAVDMFHTLAEAGGDRQRNVFENLLASHPETQERIRNVTHQVEAMMPLSDNLEQGQEHYRQMLQRLP